MQSSSIFLTGFFIGLSVGVALTTWLVHWLYQKGYCERKSDEEG